MYIFSRFKVVEVEIPLFQQFHCLYNGLRWLRWKYGSFSNLTDYTMAIDVKKNRYKGILPDYSIIEFINAALGKISEKLVTFYIYFIVIKSKFFMKNE